MKYWTRKLYGNRVSIRSLNSLPAPNLTTTKKFWLWRLAYSGLACDEAYSRLIEHFSRRILIIPAICLFDKHLSTFMNAQIITKTLTALNNKIYKENLSTLDIIRIFIIIIITTLVSWQISLLL